MGDSDRRCNESTRREKTSQHGYFDYSPIFKKSEPDLDVVHNCPEASSLHIAIHLIVSSEILFSLYAE